MSGFFLWWSAISTYRTNNLDEFKQIRTRVELEYLSMMQNKQIESN